MTCISERSRLRAGSTPFRPPSQVEPFSLKTPPVCRATARSSDFGPAQQPVLWMEKGMKHISISKNVNHDDFFLSYRTSNPLYDPDNINNFLRRMAQYLYLLLLVVDGPFIGNKAVVCALSASYVSTFAGYPVSRHLVLFYVISCLNEQLSSSIPSSRDYRRRKRR